jgi:hypothetical protein
MSLICDIGRERVNNIILGVDVGRRVVWEGRVARRIVLVFLAV